MKLEKLREEKKLLIADVKAGKITKEEAKAQ
jgi:hypothetical protein